MGVLPPLSEFFVSYKASHDSFEMDTSKLPEFISLDLARDIFTTGSLRSLLAKISGEKVYPREDYQFYTLESLPPTIDAYHAFYSRTVADLFLSRYSLKAHFYALVEFVLLRNDAFTSTLIESLLYLVECAYF